MADLVTRLTAALPDHYVIERELGMGGMATVYLARDLKHERLVALKVLRPELSAVLGVERFLSEIRVTAQLQHPHILPLFDSGNAAGLVWYAMPYVDGESLRAKLTREKQTSVEQAVGIATAVASALDYAHRHKVIHRDIKPENILLQDGQPVVADFGIALALSAAAGNRLTETGLSLGTPQYMSPEQATGERLLDGRTDIYSLGCVLYEMLAGDPPFTGSTIQSVLAQVVSERPRRLSLLRDTVPPYIESAVINALAKVPADRFATAAQFAEALVRPVPTVFQADSTTPREVAGERPRVPWRHPFVLGSLGLGVAGILVGAPALFWPREQAPAPPEVRFMLTVGRFPDAGASSVAIAPDGALIAYTAQDAQQTTHLFLRPLNRTDGVPVSGTAFATQPFFSPDGRWVGFHQEGKLKKISLASGDAVVICDAPVFFGGSWAPADWIAYSDGRSLHRVPAAGGQPEFLVTPSDTTTEDVRYWWPHVLPDAQTVLLTQVSPSSTPSLAALSLTSRRVTVLGQNGMAPHYVSDGLIVFAHTDGRLLAAPFDMRTVRLRAAPQQVAQGVRIGNWQGMTRSVVDLGVSRAGDVVFRSGPPPLSELVIVDQDGRMTVLPTPPDRYMYPRFSPDGGRIVLAVAYPTSANSGNIRLYDVTRETTTWLTLDSAGIYPEWTADGRGIVYSGRRKGSLDWDVFIVADGGSPLPLLTRALNQWQGLLALDGRTLVFYEFSQGTRNDIWSVPVDSLQMARSLVRTQASEQALDLSPDGRWLAYSSNETGTYEVYVLSLADPTARLRVSPRGGREPRWARDGRQLFFRSGDSLYVVRITGAPGLGPGPARPLLATPFPGSVFAANYDVHPDGRRFVFVRERAEAGGSVEVIVNSLHGLRREH